MHYIIKYTSSSSHVGKYKIGRRAYRLNARNKTSVEVENNILAGSKTAQLVPFGE